MSGDTKTNHWVRRRGYSKVHVKSWTIYLEKNGYVKCPFQNCNFMAFDVEEMYQHYSICNGDSSFAKFVCSICQGRTVTAEKLKNHKLKAHDVAEVESNDIVTVDNDENSNDDTNDSTIKKAALSKVVILSWKCSLEENKYIKCPECDYLEKDVSAMVNHYLDCKKDSVIACYICPECKGKAISFDILQCHMSYAHKVDISKMNFNKISPRMVQIWYDEIAHNKFARCLHKTQGVVDCLYFDTGISGIILHFQACTGAESSVGKRHTCSICKHWTDSEEKIKVHVESCHVNPLSFVSRLTENTARNSKNLDINSCFKSKMSYRDFKVIVPGKSVKVEATVGNMIFREEEETGRRKSTEDKMCGRKDYGELSVMRDSIGYNLFDEVEIIDATDGKTDLNEDAEFVSTDVKDSVQPSIDLPPDVSNSTSSTYCLAKEDDTFLHSDLLNPSIKEERRSRSSDAVYEVSVVETRPGILTDVAESVDSIMCLEGKRRDVTSSPKRSVTKSPKSLENTTHSVDLNKLNQNVKPDDTSKNTLVVSEEVGVSKAKSNIRVTEKLSKNIVNNSTNSGKIKTECQQESYRDEGMHSIEITDVKNSESEIEKNEKVNTVCNYVVEVCNEDQDKDVLCFKITDLDESKNSVQPVESENALIHDMTQSSKPDISFQSDDGSVKNVYVVSTDLADTADTQNITTTIDDRNMIVNDSNKLCTPDSSNSVSVETPEEAISLVADCAAGTSSGPQNDNESPRIVQFFKKGRLSLPILEKKKVVCIEYRKGALFHNRLFRPKCTPVSDDKRPNSSGVDRKFDGCLKSVAEANSSKLSSDTASTSQAVSEETYSIAVQINDNEPELIPIQDVSETVKDNSIHVLKNDNLGNTKIVCNQTVVSVEDSVKEEHHRNIIKQESAVNSITSKRILDNEETVGDTDKVAVDTVFENSEKDRIIDKQKNESELDVTPKMKASQVDGKSSGLENDVKCSDSVDGGDVDHNTENNLLDCVQKVVVTQKKNVTEKIVSEIEVGGHSEECSGKDEKNKQEVATGEKLLKSEELNLMKHMKHVGVRVSLGVQIKDMSVAKLRKIKRPIKNLVRKFCKEELRKYRSSKKYFRSKKPIKNLARRIKSENKNAKACQLVEGDLAAVEEQSSVSLSSDVKCEENELCRNLTVEKSNHQKPEDTCVLEKTQEIASKGNNSNIEIHNEESGLNIIGSGNQIIENASETNTSENSELMDTTYEKEPTEEQNSSPSLKKYTGKKEKITNVKDAVILQNATKKVGKYSTIDEMEKESRPEQSSEISMKQESNVNKNILDELKTTDESNHGGQERTASPKQCFMKKMKVKEYTHCSSVSDGRKHVSIEGQDKTMKSEDDKTICSVGKDEQSILSPRTLKKSKLLNNSEKEDILMDSADIKETEMNLVRKVKYVDELEANYSNKKAIVHNVDDDNDNEEIFIYLTEDCKTGKRIERVSKNVNSNKAKEIDESAKKDELPESIQTGSTDESKHNKREQLINTSMAVPPSDGVPVKRKRGRPSKQELLQRKLNQQNIASDLSSQVINDPAASSTPNTPSRLRRRTSISRRYLEDENSSLSYSERRKRSRHQPLWYMTPETSNDSTDSSPPSSKKGKFLRTSKEDDKGSSSEDEGRNEDVPKEHSENVNSGSRNETESNKHGNNESEGAKSNLNDVSISSEVTPVKRKRGRPRKNFNISSDSSQSSAVKESVSQRSKASVDSGDDDDNVSVSVGGDSESESLKRRPVIKAKTFCKIQSEDFDNSSLRSMKDDDNYSAYLNENVKCGKCGEEMIRKKYLRQHKMKHYNLCWLEGEEPIDYANQDEVVNLLQRAQKKFRMKMSFKCETCGVSKKSAVGYQSHLVFCGKSKEERDALMESCSVCGRIMMPSSLKVHMGAAHGNKPDSVSDEVQEEEIQNFVRGKRAAATRAESALQDSLADFDDGEITQKKRSKSPVDDITRQLYKRPPLNTNPYQLSKWRKVIAEIGFGACYFPMCTFQSNEIDVLRVHAKHCPHAPPKVYSCRMCDFDAREETAMIAHVREKHEEQVLAVNAAISEESSSDGEESSESLLTTQRTTPFQSKYPKLKFVRELGKQYGSRFFHQALKLTYDMREENYSKNVLFNDLKPKHSEWTSMKEDELEQYLPKTRTSVRLVTKNVEWHQIQLFESDFIDGVLTLFAGGPVWAAAWAPVRDVDSQQYLAVACHPDMDLEHAMGRTYTYKSLIQIWKFDQLDNMKTDITKPKLIYGIAHDHGAVWSLEWCPSGCSQDDRIGIFAAACSDGFIYIYSVPHEDADGSCKICKPKPSIVLNLGSEMIAQCTRLAWHKVKPHSVIAAGFASGMVGLWDLNTKSQLLRCDNMYYPFHVFQPHQSSVSGLCFGPNETPQYLATASVDCSHKFWDLRDTTAPVTVHRKGCVTDLVWMQNWLSTVNAYDEVYGYAVSSVLLSAYRDFCYQPCSLSPQIGVTWSLSCNDWINSIACGDETGRVIVSLPLQIAHIDEKKVKKNSKLALLNTLHDFGEIQEVKLPQDKDEKSDAVKKEEKQEDNSLNDPENAASFLKYNEAVARYGLSLKVDKQGIGIDQTQNKAVAPLSNPNMYPLTAITKVSWNTNFRSFVFLAAGFHCGIVVIPRTSYVRSTDLLSLYRKRGSTK